MIRRHSFTVISACFVAAIFASGSPAISSEEGSVPVRFHLPQVSARTTVVGKSHRLLRKVFVAGAEVKSVMPLPREAEQFLLGALPAPYDNACEEMVATWGLGARSVPSIRVLATHVGPGDSGWHILTAYRCACDPETFGKEYYDERIMFLSIGAVRSALAMIPHEPDRDLDSNLSRIGIPAEMRVREGPVLAVPIETSSDNPCCDGPYALKERKTFYLHLTEDGFGPAGEVLLSREEYEHDDVDGDRTTMYDADCEAVRDSTGNVSRLVSNYRVVRTEEYSGRSETIEKGKKIFVFDRKERKFVPGR